MSRTLSLQPLHILILMLQPTIAWIHSVPLGGSNFSVAHTSTTVPSRTLSTSDMASNSTSKIINAFTSNASTGSRSNEGRPNGFLPLVPLSPVPADPILPVMPPVTDAPAREPLNTGADTEPLGTDPQETECQSTASSLDSAVRSTSIREDQSTQRPQETSSQLIPSETSSSAPTGITTATCVSCIAYLSLNFTSGTYSGTDSDGEGRDKKARRRNIARKARIKKRWGGETKTLLRRGDGTAPCQVLPYTMRPPYPGPSEVVQWENAPNANVTMAPFYRTATYWAIPTDEPNHGGLGWEYRDTPAVRLPRVPGAPVWQVGGNRRGNRKIVNIDHVYEVSLLDEFFASRITPSFDCTDISRLFDVYDYTHYPDRVGTRLNTIYSQLASYSNPDFLGMDGGLNDLKGNLWNPPSGQPGKLQGMPQVLTKNGEDYLQGLAAITVVMDMVNDPVIRRLFNSTNERIFKAFAGIDEVVRQAARSCPYRDHNNRPMSATWASAYSEWISTKISGQNSLIVTTAGQYSMSVPTVAAAHALPADRSRTESWSTWMSNYNNKYDDINSLTFPAPTTWPAGHLTMRKRDDPARIGSCARVNSTNQSMLAAPGSTVRSASSTVPPSMTLGPINTSIPIASTAAMTSKPLVFGSTSSVPATPLTIPTSTASPSRTNNGDLCGPALQDSSDYPDSCNATVKMAPSPRPPPTASNIKQICVQMAHPATPNNTWIWSQRQPSCALGFFLPPYPGSAPLPSRERCKTMIFAAMVRACANWLPIDVASVNLKELPSAQGNGAAVNVGYPSYLIAPLKLGQ